jgi:hypothetical protein
MTPINLLRLIPRPFARSPRPFDAPRVRTIVTRAVVARMEGVGAMVGRAVAEMKGKVTQ